MADEKRAASPQTGLARSLKISRDKIDAAKRTLEVAFSSEAPVERWGENEVLSHDKGDYDFSRLNDSHPLLLGHDEYDPKSQIGVIESARVDGDKIGRAVVRFGNSALATEIFQDVVDGIRELVSVGYDRTGVVSSKKAADNMVTTRYRWMPSHIAIVPVPADTSVGVGREKPAEQIPPVDLSKFTNVEQIADSLTIEQKKRMRILLDPTPAAGGGGAPALVIDEPKLRSEVAQATRTTVEGEFRVRTEKVNARNKEIKALADAFVKDHGLKWAGKRGEVVVVGERIRAFEQEAYNAPADHSDSEVRTDFKTKCGELVRDSRPPKNQEEAANLPAELAKRCSFMGAVRSALENSKGVKSTALLPAESAELDAHNEIVHRLPDFPGGTRILEQGGFFLPSGTPAPVRNQSRRDRQQRDSLASDFSTAGATIVPDFRPMIELLRNQLVCARLGATFLGGLIGDVVFPRQEAATVAQSLPEGAQLAPYDQVLGQIRMSPHRIGSRQYYSRLAVLQSSLDFEAFVLNDHMQVIALYMDLMALNGSGAADQPLGVLNQPGINQVIFGGTPTYAQIVAFRTAIRSFNVNGPIGFATTSVGQGRLSVLPAGLVGATLVSGVNGALWIGDEDNGSLIGAQAISSQQIPGNILLAGVFSNLLIAQWGGINVVIDNFTRADRDEVAITTNTYMDSAVRHAQAFTRSADSANQ